MARLTAIEVRAAYKAGTPIRVRSTVDGDCGWAHRVSNAKDWSKGYVEVKFDNGQRVWVRQSHLVRED
jgi:hypothetical protein